MNISHLYRIENTKNGKYYIGKHNGVEQNGYYGKSNYRINKELKESYLNQGFLLGRTSFTKEARENIKKSVIGRKHSEETKLKISQSNKLTKKGKLNG